MTTTAAQAEHTEEKQLTLHVLGMTCAACQHHVEQALNKTPGVHSARVDLMANKAQVTLDAETEPSTLVDAIRKAGYDAVLPRPSDSTLEVTAETSSSSRKAFATIGAGIFAMLLSMPLNMGTASIGSNLDRLLMHAIPALYTIPSDFLRGFLFAITAILILIAGRTIYLSAWKATRHGTTNMNTLVALGTGVAFFYSAYNTFTPTHGAVYYDSVLLILGFLLLGKWLEARAKQRALAALDSLARLQPITARIRRNGEETIVDLEHVLPGDQVIVLPGERFPVDATILEGRTTVDESMLTGESTPLAREPGGKVLAGSLNYDGAVACQASSLGKDTVLSQMTRIVEQAQGSRAPMERLADRASAIFVPIVLSLAVLTFAVWLLTTHSLQMAISSTVAVLVIACPCAMGLAVPAALTVAIGRAAQLGVLYKGGEALERVATLDTLILDKTGTLTVGRPVLELTIPLAQYPENELLRLAAAAEEHSNHPLAHAIIDAAHAKKLQWPAAQNTQVFSGRGLTSTVDVYNLLIGNAALFSENLIKLPTVLDPASGTTRLWIAIDNQPAGYFDARDALHPDAVASIATLKSSGLFIEMLTGDSVTASAPIAEAAGISSYKAGLQPMDKLDRIRVLQQEGHKVGMAGDGINDAAALAQADAGLAMGSGADLAQEAGDVLLVQARPSALVTAILLARATTRIMRQNLWWAAIYNVLGIPLAAGVLYPAFHILLDPWLASAAMALSSVSVLANSLRLKHWQVS